MVRSIDADILHATADAEGVEAAVVVVGRPVAPMYGDIEEVAAFDEPQVAELDARFESAVDPCGLELFDVGVRAVDRDTIRGEEAHPEHEVLDRSLCVTAKADAQGVATIADSGYVWTSNLTGMIGTGPSLQATLPEGTHQVTVTVTDSLGRMGTDTVKIISQPPIG